MVYKKNLDKFIETGGFRCIEDISPAQQYELAYSRAEMMLARAGERGIQIHPIDHGAVNELAAFELVLKDVDGMHYACRRYPESHVLSGKPMPLEQRAAPHESGEFRPILTPAEEAAIKGYPVVFLIDDWMTTRDVYREIAGYLGLESDSELNSRREAIGSMIVGVRNAFLTGNGLDTHIIPIMKKSESTTVHAAFDEIRRIIIGAGRYSSTSVTGGLYWGLTNMDALGAEEVHLMVVKDRANALGDYTIVRSKALQNNFDGQMMNLVEEKPWLRSELEVRELLSHVDGWKQHRCSGAKGSFKKFASKWIPDGKVGGKA